MKEKNKKMETRVPPTENKRNSHRCFFTFFKVFLILILFFGGITIYATKIEPHWLRVEEIPITSSSLPTSFDGLKGMLLSDIHYRSTTTKDDLNKIVTRINLERPDYLFFTGDLLTNNVSYSEEDWHFLKSALSNIHVSLEKFAVLGDQDYRYYDKVKQVLEEASFTVLENNHKYLYYEGNTPIKIVGISSYLQKQDNVSEAFQYLEEDNLTDVYTITLGHEPGLISQVTDAQTNLFLAGHSLGGSIRFPISGGIVSMDATGSYMKGSYYIGQIHLLVSSGIGTERIPARLFNPPSMTLLRFYTN